MADALRTAGFVLAGGRSSRMGRDKALLDAGGRTLLERVAAAVREAAGSVTVIAPPERYRHLGLPIIADARPGEGPLAGIEAALDASEAEWNLIVACDMPNLEPEVLGRLLEFACASAADCVAGLSERGPEPLLAAYHRRALPAVRAALDAGERRVTSALDALQVVYFEIDNHAITANVNTPAEWRNHLG
ncbi:MAG: molybdenum cofactor guanylyltransferase [Bryobacteraceae bacterium]